MKTEIYQIKKTGYGHWQITIEHKDEFFSATTTDSITIDSYNDGVEKARIKLIKFVKKQNNL